MQRYGFSVTVLVLLGLVSTVAQADDCEVDTQRIMQQAVKPNADFSGLLIPQAIQPNADVASLLQQTNQILVGCERTVELHVIAGHLFNRLSRWSEAATAYRTALNYILAFRLDPTRKIEYEVMLRLLLTDTALQGADRASASEELSTLLKLQRTGRLNATQIAQIQQKDLALSNDLNTRPLQAQELIRAAGKRDLVAEPLELNYRIAFAFNQSQLNAEAQQILTGMVEALRVASIKKITVIGHTDQRGGSSYNQRLSEQRAQAVVSFLVKQAPDLTAKLRAEGRGMSELLSMGNSENDHAQNRRVEFVFGN